MVGVEAVNPELIGRQMPETTPVIVRDRTGRPRHRIQRMATGNERLSPEARRRQELRQLIMEAMAEIEARERTQARPR